ncbi:hypothetical protein HK104_010930 [Borealophlyctis nickersoniae]|nr:hypothetical protein HK104_010930 [Borealophlyctis nickersoniae]
MQHTPLDLVPEAPDEPDSLPGSKTPALHRSRLLTPSSTGPQRLSTVERISNASLMPPGAEGGSAGLKRQTSLVRQVSLVSTDNTGLRSRRASITATGGALWSQASGTSVQQKDGTTNDAQAALDEAPADDEDSMLVSSGIGPTITMHPSRSVNLPPPTPQRPSTSGGGEGATLAATPAAPSTPSIPVRARRLSAIAVGEDGMPLREKDGGVLPVSELASEGPAVIAVPKPPHKEPEHVPPAKKGGEAKQSSMVKGGAPSAEPGRYDPWPLQWPGVDTVKRWRKEIGRADVEKDDWARVEERWKKGTKSRVGPGTYDSTRRGTRDRHVPNTAGIALRSKAGRFPPIKTGVDNVNIGPGVYALEPVKVEHGDSRLSDTLSIFEIKY